MEHRLFFRRPWMLYALILPVLAVILFPFFVMVSTSLKSKEEILNAKVWSWLPQHVMFSNYLTVFRESDLGHFLLNSILVAAMATVVVILVALPAAYALARLQFRGRTLFLGIILTTQMFSPIVIIIGLYRVAALLQTSLADHGWNLAILDTRWALAVIYAAFNLSFAIWMLAGFLQSIPLDVEEAALIDGCSRLRLMVSILLPLIRPGMVAVVIFSFIAAWNEYVVALTFMADHKTLSVGIFTFFAAYEIRWDYLMCTAVLATVPVVVLFLAIEKHLVKGLTAGAVK